MEIKYGHRIQQAPELLALARQANARLEEKVRSSANPAAAEWDCSEDRLGRPIVTLRLSDFSGSVTTVFEPQELETPAQMKRRLNRLWGGLLRVRGDVLLRQLQEAGDPVEG